MKKILILGMAVLMGTAWAAAPTAEKVKRSYHASSKLYDRAEYFSIRNDANAYLVYFQWIKPTAKSPGRVVVGLPEPVFWQGFVSRDFTRLTVNGISSVELEPKSIETFCRDGIAGVDALYNFDGIRMTLRFYMTEQSPMLFMEWRKDPAPEGTVERAELAFSVYPSYSVPNGGKRDERYQREIQTPARTIPSPKNTAWVKLAPADASFIMYDRTFEPSNTPKAQGPCFLAVDWKRILSGRELVGKIYVMDFRFTLDPKADCWRFGLGKTKSR
ncbi:MAG: hypothetical protein V8T87_06775 [Victivallales bacterium]